MKVLIISPHYYPEEFKITRLAEELAKSHEVTVFTNIPNYPKGSYYEGYGVFKKRRQTVNGVRIKRIFEIPRKQNMFFLILNYLSFMFFGILRLLFHFEKYDIVLSNSLSPVTALAPGIVYSKTRNIPHIGYVLDLWPNSIKVIKDFSENGFIYRVTKFFSFKFYKSLDKILVSSYSFEGFFKKNGIIPKNGFTYFPNFGEEIFEQKILNPEYHIKFDSRKTNVLFAGNVGKAQNLTTLIDIAIRLKEIKNDRIRFHIVGDGSERNHLVSKVNELQLSMYFEFHGSHPISAMPNYYLAADILFFSLINDDVISLTLPGKIQGYMAVEKPIYAISRNESKEVIEKYKYGYCDDTYNKEHIFDSFMKFISRFENGSLELNKEYYNENFNMQVLISRLNEVLDQTRK